MSTRQPKAAAPNRSALILRSSPHFVFSLLKKQRQRALKLVRSRLSALATISTLKIGGPVLLLRKYMVVAMRKRGRPPKFEEPRRPVTVTLPETTLARLAAIDSDRSRAIVKATDAAAPRDAEIGHLPELIEVAPGVSVILVGPSRCLREIKWLRLMEIAPSRFLLIIPSGTSIDSLELAIIDLLENTKTEDPWETAGLQRLRNLIGTLRRGSELSKAELLVIERRTD